jgi:selenide,water dikinase
MPVLEGVRESLAAGHVPGGSRRNLEWVRPNLDVGPGVTDEDLIVLADAQTSGGLLVVGEVPGAPVIGETVAMPTPRVRVLT